ncbi:MAG: putative Ig domain-containing protein, partial [Variovorax sp.]
TIDASISKADAAGNVGVAADAGAYTVDITAVPAVPAPAPAALGNIPPPVTQVTLPPPAPLPATPPTAGSATSGTGLPAIGTPPATGGLTDAGLGMPVDPGVAPSNLGVSRPGSAAPGDAASAIAAINALPATAAGPVAEGLRGFPVAWVSAADAALNAQSSAFGVTEHRLFVFHGIPNNQLEHNGPSELRIPSDAFAHTDPVAVVLLEARLADGRPLPDWLKFDRMQGTLSGEPPEGLAGELDIEVIARDTEGREARTAFKLSIEAIRTAEKGAAPAERNIELGLDVDQKEAEKARLAAERAAAEARSGAAKPGDGKARPQGAAGFSEQLRGAKAARDLLVDRVAKSSDPARRTQ